MPREINDTLIQKIQETFREVKISEPLERHTTFRLPCTASVFVNVRTTEELISLLTFIKQNDIRRYKILGGGSNVIFLKNIYDGVIIKLDGDFRKISRQTEPVKNTLFLLTAGGGAMLPTVEAFATREGLAGFEILSGIPGTTGGAVVINAGTRYGSVSDILFEVTVMDKDLSIKKLPADGIKFSYRDSSLKGLIVLSATFALKEEKPSDILKKIDAIMKERSAGQPHLPSAGCIFKNPPPPAPPAGKLIDSCGLKGITKGNAMIAAEHANFIVNKGGATSEDVMYLAELARRKVKEKYGINLEFEVEIIE